MAGLRNRTHAPVASSPWIEDERAQIKVFIDQEKEDFEFAARNEVEWLNEHMAEVFSTSGVNVTEIFKTPGKLRGKTPRTARRQNPYEARAPLTNIFTSNLKHNVSPQHRLSPQKTAAAASMQTPEAPSLLPVKTSQHHGNPFVDSGYHEMTEDDMEVDKIADVPLEASKPLHNIVMSTDNDLVAIDYDEEEERRRSATERTTEGSFHSAKEDVTTREINGKPQEKVSAISVLPEKRAAEINEEDKQEVKTIEDFGEVIDVEMNEAAIMEDDRESLLDEDQAVATTQTPSEGSSPVKPIVRKSSLTFASLPAREPLTTKRSIGARTSRTSHLDQTKPTNMGRGSFLGRFTGGKSLGNQLPQEPIDTQSTVDDMDLEDYTDSRPGTRDGPSEVETTAQLHNKSSTQRLHERINMLGKLNAAKPARTTTFNVPTQPQYPLLPTENTAEPSKEVLTVASREDDDDDWIKPPPKTLDAFPRPQLSKSRSVDVMENINGIDSIGGKDLGIGPNDVQAVRQGSPLRSNSITENTSISPARLNSALPALPREQQDGSPIRAHGEPSTTPAGPLPASRLHYDGPLSASKSKLQSIMRSARGLFTSSAGASAQAKMETLSPSTPRTRSKMNEHASPGKSIGPSTLSSEIYPTLSEAARSATTVVSEARKTRSSTEREEKAKSREITERQVMDDKLEQAREQERIKAAAVAKEYQARVTPAGSAKESSKVISEPIKPTRQSPRRPQKAEIVNATADIEASLSVNEDLEDFAQQMPPPPPKSQPLQAGKGKEIRRQAKPTKETLPKPKPQPVAIKVGTLSQRIPLSTAALSSSLQDSLAPPNPTSRPPTLVKKASTASIQTSSSTTSLSRSVSSTASKPKALIAAERKKEQDEKEAQRKLEHKREIERKRAAQNEENQRRELQKRQELEKQRERERSVAAAEDAKKAAQKQAMEKKRIELMKKDQTRSIQRPLNDLGHALQQEKAQSSQHGARSDLGGNRPQSRMVQEFPKPPSSQYPVNTAKPPVKRVFDPDQDDEPRPVRKPVGQSYQQNEAKRRRTNEEDFPDVPVRPTMEPPIRQSNIHKNASKPSIFGPSYPSIPSSMNGQHGPSSLLKTSTLNQTYQQYANHPQNSRPPHLDMAKYTNGKIPFAEAPNPPQASHHQQSQYKTPLPSKLANPSQHHHKSSPLASTTDNIQLDDIPTDSEGSDDDDDDSDAENKKKKKDNLPEWALTPEIRRALLEQDAIDTDALFGPIQPPNMEDMFRNGDKSRQARFRARTSSANWGGQDRLTQDEIRRDVEARERMRREGGWTFGI
ncbi:hypothetical protein MMC25_004330 [Agyrium rufum]|nr:hypothetical protein [Agyrium rufum]